MRFLMLVSFVFASSTAFAFDDWASFRGTDGKGVASKGVEIGGTGSLGLKVRWKKKLGSGYSSVVVADSSVVTMYCDDNSDYVISLSAQSGDVNWQVKVGESFKGENGSFNGPISTPLIYRGKVYALDPGGKLVCLSLKDGTEVWTKDLVKDFKSTKPMYGFATSPIAVGDLLVLQTGARDGSLAGIDLESGAVRWKTTTDSINSQTPVAMSLEGTPVVLAAGGKFLSGVDAVDGTKLFEFEHNGGNGSAMVPVVSTDNSVVLTLDDSFSKAVTLNPVDQNQVNVSERWQERSIKNTYNVPVLCNGNLFAYSTRILTCVDPETGKPRWKSRKPGDGFLIGVGNMIVVNTKKGTLHVAKATDEKYVELGQLKLFDDLVWSLPAYSDGAIYCRSLGEIACVELIGESGLVDAAPTDSLPMGKDFRGLVDAVLKETSAEERQAIVNKYMQQQKQFPVIEGDIIQFVFQGQAKDVALAGDMFGARQERPMIRLADTDCYYYAMKLPSDQRANYVYLVDYVPQLDVKNDRKTTSSVYAGEMEFAVRLRNEKPLEMSWFAMPDWKEPAYLNGLDMQIKGTMVQHKIDASSESSDAEVYLPPGYKDGERSYPTIYVFSDPTHKTNGKLIPALEKMFESDSELEPTIVVFPIFVPFGPNQKSLAKDLIPSIDKTFRTIKDRMSRRCVGFGMMAGGALAPTVENPDLISGAVVYSPMVFDAGIRQIENALDGIQDPLDVYIEWGRFDMFNPHENWDVREIGQKLWDEFDKHAKVNIRGGMVNDSGDWASWRNRYDAFMKK